MKGVTSVTVSVPLTFRRRGGRKQIIGPDGAVARQGDGRDAIVPVHGDPALIKALARGFRWRRMLEEGRYASISEMATAEKIERGYLGSLLRLTLLAPEMVDTVDVVEDESLAAIASTVSRIFFFDASSRSLNSTLRFPFPLSLPFALSPFLILALYSANLFSAA